MPKTKGGKGDSSLRLGNKLARASVLIINNNINTTIFLLFGFRSCVMFILPLFYQNPPAWRFFCLEGRTMLKPVL